VTSVYISYLVFQLFSHKSLYDSSKKSQKPDTVPYSPKVKNATNATMSKAAPSEQSAVVAPDVESSAGQEEDVEEEIPKLSVPVTVILLVVVTVLVAVTAEWLVDSIDGLASGGSISKEFIGLILLPIVGNAAEHVTAVAGSVKDKLTLSLGVAVGSSIVSDK
jgi:Ca2+:H+ antiporter